MRIDKNPYGWSLDDDDQKAKPADEPEESKLGFLYQHVWYFYTKCSILYVTCLCAEFRLYCIVNNFEKPPKVTSLNGNGTRANGKESRRRFAKRF